MRLVAPAVAAQIEGDDAMIAREIGQDSGLYPGTLEIGAEAVDKEHRGAAAVVDIADAHSGGVEAAILRRSQGRKQAQ